MLTLGAELGPGGVGAGALPALLNEAAAIAGIDAGRLALLRDKVREQAFNLVVCGEFKRGKSTLINALLGADVLPTAVVPLTSVVTVLMQADEPRAEVVLDGGERQPIAIDALPDYVTERGNPGNAKGVREVLVGWPAAWLAGGLRLVDTPGIGSVHQHNTEVTRRCLPEADAVIVVASVEQPLGRNELDFLAEIRAHAGKVFCLLNKIDQLGDDELAESTAFVTRVLDEALGAEVPVFPVSARLALRARLAGDEPLVQRSGVGRFDAALRTFLARDRGAVWLRSVRQQLLRLVDEVRLSAELEQAALATPLAALDERLEAFAAKKTEALQARSDFDALLDADGRAIVRDQVAPAIEALGRSLPLRLRERLDGWADELRTLGSAALQTELEERLVGEIRRAVDAWRAELEAQVAANFERVCQRHAQRIRRIVDELLQFSAGLFDLPFAAAAADSPWRARAAFRFKFWDAPPSMRLIRGALVRSLPTALGRAIIVRDAKRRADDLVSTQSGRLRHDFADRVERNLRDLQREIGAQADATIAGIETAIGRARTLREQGAASTAARRAELAATLAAVQRLRDRIAGKTDTG